MTQEIARCDAGGAVRADPRPDCPQEIRSISISATSRPPSIALEKKKLLPLSFPLSEGGRARAWTGGQILDHRAEMQKRAEAELAAAKDQPPMPQPKALDESAQGQENQTATAKRFIDQSTRTAR